MKPQDHRTPNLTIPSRQTVAPISSTRDTASHEAAANIARGQIDSIYRQDNAYTDKAASEQPTPTPQSHTSSQPHHQTTASAWQKYHSAWQSYYQQYYERYYVGQVYQAKKDLEATSTVQAPIEQGVTKEEAIEDLRSELRKNVENHAKKARASRHFWPIVAAVGVMLVFLFLQYNRVIFSNVQAYVTPGEMDPQSIIIDPNASMDVGPEPRVIIPRVNIDVPIDWSAVASSQESLNKAMDHGAAWFNIPGASARPGEIGNSVFSAHSSNDWLDQTNYKFAFAPLVNIKEGDTVYINYNSKRYTYTVTHTKVVKPTDVAALTDPVNKPIITLITCVPLGTANNRLLVFADQVSPDPSAATQKEQSTESTAVPAAMPRNSPTFIERLFGAK